MWTIFFIFCSGFGILLDAFLRIDALNLTSKCRWQFLLMRIAFWFRTCLLEVWVKNESHVRNEWKRRERLSICSMGTCCNGFSIFNVYQIWISILFSYIDFLSAAYFRCWKFSWEMKFLLNKKKPEFISSRSNVSPSTPTWGQKPYIE